MKLSVIIISYKSEKLIRSILKVLPKNFEIIIIENSLDVKMKKNIEKKFKNTNVIIPSKNLGYASAFNLGYSRCKNKFVLTLTPDVTLNRKLISKIQKILKSFKNFTLIAPEYKNQKIYKNYSPISDEKLKFRKIKSIKIEEVKDIDWCFCILNKSKFKNNKVLDENYFLYFETMDLCKKLYKKKHKMYILKDLKFTHLGTSSSEKKFNLAIQLNRNWHFSWSKFYYFRKNFSYFFALKKVLPNIYQSIVGIILSLIKLNYDHIKLHFYVLLGVLNAIFLRKSYYRPEINE